MKRFVFNDAFANVHVFNEAINEYQPLCTYSAAGISHFMNEEKKIELAEIVLKRHSRIVSDNVKAQHARNYDRKSGTRELNKT